MEEDRLDLEDPSREGPGRPQDRRRCDGCRCSLARVRRRRRCDSSCALHDDQCALHPDDRRTDHHHCSDHNCSDHHDHHCTDGGVFDDDHSADHRTVHHHPAVQLAASVGVAAVQLRPGHSRSHPHPEGGGQDRGPFAQVVGQRGPSGRKRPRQGGRPSEEADRSAGELEGRCSPDQARGGHRGGMPRLGPRRLMRGFRGGRPSPIRCGMSLPMRRDIRIVHGYSWREPNEGPIELPARCTAALEKREGLATSGGMQGAGRKRGAR